MWSITKKEIQSFFSTILGYVIIGSFLLLIGLFLWFFKGNFNIFNNGFADLSPFFLLCPWVFLFIVPAITMKAFAEERNQGTLELLVIKPITIKNLVAAKYLGNLFISILTLLPTIIYVWAISDLGTTPGNFDSGVVLGSYFGLVLLLGTYTAIGLFASSLTKSQILAFIVGFVLCFCIFYGFEAFSSLFTDGNFQLNIKKFGAYHHFESIAKGVMDTKDLVYFISTTLFFLFLVILNLKNMTG